MAGEASGGPEREQDPDRQLGGALHPDTEVAIVRYIERTKGWRREDYTIEPRGTSIEGAQRFAILHVDDRRAPAPGAGKSVELEVTQRNEIARELAGQ